MVYITHRTPSAYWNRHPDWYRGALRNVAHSIGLIGEGFFYFDCEGKCAEAKTFWRIIPVIGDVVANFFVSIHRSHYKKNYVYVYDDWALQACKQFEQLEGQIAGVIDQIKRQVDEARRYIETNLINPIKDKINRELVPRINNLLSRVKTAESTIRDAQNRVTEALNDVARLDDTVKFLNDKVNSTKTELDQAISDFQSKMNKLDLRLGDANSFLADHEKRIKELFNRVNALEGKTVEQEDKLAWFKKQLEVLI